MDPLTILLVGTGALVFREMNKKDYGVLTPSRDERYRNAMEYCHQPDALIEEARLFTEYGLKAQAAMLKRRAEWRGRPAELKQAHEEVYQKALKSDNIPAILEVAFAFEGWTATKKASALREHVRVIQEKMLAEVAQRAAEAAEAEEKAYRDSLEAQTAKKTNGAGTAKPFVPVEDTEMPQEITNDD
jgi:hypothetical protein